MPGLYLYAVTSRPVQPGVHGIFGRPVRSVAAGRLHAVVERAGRAPKPTLARLEAQSRVLAALVRRGSDLLPARFGTYLPSREALAGALDARRSELRAALRRTRGCVQMTLRFAARRTPRRTPSSTAGGQASSGTNYLRARVAVERARRENPQLLGFTRATERFVRAGRVEWRSGTATVFHLVPRTRLSAYAAAVCREAEAQQTNVILSGPFAPFAFVEIE